MIIRVIGNGNSGAKTANIVLKEARKKASKVIYYYEYPPHDGVTFDHELTAVQTSKLNISNFEAQDLIISCGWAHKLQYELVKNGNCYNIHPSLLPKYRGIMSIEKQFSDGVDISGITLHRMDMGYDTGPVFARVIYKITGLSEDEIVKTGMIALNKLICCFFQEYPNIHCVDQNDMDFESQVRSLVLF